MQRSYDKTMFYKLVAHLMENPNLKFFSGKYEQMKSLHPANRNDESKHKKATTILWSFVCAIPVDLTSMSQMLLKMSILNVVITSLIII